MNKRNIYIFGGAAILIVVVGFFYVRNISQPSYQLATVKRASITQEASASGSVASPTTINLQFQSQGKLAYVGVKVGDKVTSGKMIARQDVSVLNAQLQQAQAAVDAQLAQLDTLKQGTRPEQLAILRSQVASDEAALAQAIQATVDAIKNAYTVSDNAVEHVVDHFFSDPHSSNPQISFLVGDSQLETNVESKRLLAETVLTTWVKDVVVLSASSNVNVASAEARSNLSSIMQLVDDSSAALSKAISSQQANQSQLNQWMTDVIATRNALNAASSALTSAMTGQKTALSALDRDQKSLALGEAGSTASVISAQQAVVAQAQAQVAALRAQIAQATLVAPVAGTITQVNGEVGEVVSPGTLVLSIMPDAKLQTDVNLSEDNVGTVKVSNPVRITLDAFPGVEWRGVVSHIDPAQTVIGGAVYYKTTVVFNQPDIRIKSGMTANVRIETGNASSTLVVPASAIQTNGTSTLVELLQNGRKVSQSVTTGLKSQDGMTEVISGLSEGDQVVIGD